LEQSENHKSESHERLEELARMKRDALDEVERLEEQLASTRRTIEALDAEADEIRERLD